MNVVLALCSFALCGLSFELWLRLFLPMAPLPTGSRTALPALATRPHFEASIFAQNVISPTAHVVEAWTGARYPIGAQGYRGRGFEWQKREGVTRIAVYGGSAAFDVGRSDDDDWPSHAGRLLQQRIEQPVEVINAAVPGHTSFDNLGVYLAEGHRLAADYVLLYQGWNDIKYFRDPRPILRQYHPYRIGADPLARPTGRLDALLAERSHLYRFVRLRWLIWNHRAEAEGLPPVALEHEVDPAQIRQFELIVATFVDLVRNSGGEPVLVTEARLVATANRADQHQRIRYDYVGLDHDTLLAAYGAIDAAVERVAVSKHVPLIDAHAVLGGVDANFLDHVHLTPSGSDALAELVSERLAGLLDRTPSRKLARAEAGR
jgi:lysophospholipase L1-like esterase